jgi:hypothetical protein
MITNKVIGKGREGSVLALSLSPLPTPQCLHANPADQNQEKKVSSQEGNGGSKIADTDKAQSGQSVSSCATFSY